jgi:hypothetical protein
MFYGDQDDDGVIREITPQIQLAGGKAQKRTT